MQAEMPMIGRMGRNALQWLYDHGRQGEMEADDYLRADDGERKYMPVALDRLHELHLVEYFGPNNMHVSLTPMAIATVQGWEAARDATS